MNAYDKLLQIVYLSTNQKNTKELFLCFKGESLGIKMQLCETSQDLTNMHNDGNSYVVRSMGFFNSEGILIGFGMKTIDTLIKGKVREEGIYGSP